MIRFAIVERREAREAYQWHRGFAGNYEFIFPRTWADYERLILDRQVWCAQDRNGDYVGSAYFSFDETNTSWEIGGVMVVKSEKGKGVAGVLARLTLGHVLTMENPIRRNHRVIAHIHAENQDPVNLFTKALKFSMPEKPQEFPGDHLPGLKKNAKGNVEGFELTMGIPDSVNAIADWCDQWDRKLKDKRETVVVLNEGITLAKWSQALRQMMPGNSPKPALRRIR